MELEYKKQEEWRTIESERKRGGAGKLFSEVLAIGVVFCMCIEQHQFHSFLISWHTMQKSRPSPHAINISGAHK